MNGKIAGIGTAAEITALMARLKARGLVGVKPPLTPEEVEQEFNRLRNAGRGKAKD